MASTEVEIANSALRKLGAERIASLSEDNKRARLIQDAFPLLRDEVLRAHPWNFAINRRELAQVATDPISGFTRQYQIPVDILRVLWVSDGTVADTPYHSNRVAIHPWAREGDRILCEVSPCKIVGIKQVTDVSKFGANFVEVLAMRLAADIAYAVTQSSTMQQSMFQAYEQFLRTARSFDAQEGSVQQVTASEWLDVRQ